MGNRLETAGVKLSEIGLGIEHFARHSHVPGLTRDESSEQIIQEAYRSGITHYDLVFNLPYFFDIFREFMHTKRNKITFTHHMGSFYNEKRSGHVKTRSLKKIAYTFEDMLERLNTDYVDISLIQFVTHYEDFEKCIKSGIVDYAMQLKEENKAKAIGLSAHKPALLSKIISKIDLDVIMLPINFATGWRPELKQLLTSCKKKGIGVIAIKNLLKGKAFTTKKSNYSAYYCAGSKFSMKLDKAATPADCINYALDLGIDSVVFGVKKVDELRKNVESFRASKDSKEYTYFEQLFKQTIESL